MKLLGANATLALLPYSELADELHAMLVAQQRGEVSAPPRTILELPGGGTLLIMPATSAALTSIKIVTVHTTNAALELPSVQADVLALDTATGRRLLLLDGGLVTARRTAALSLLAARMLAPRPDGPLLIVGAGTQGQAHLEAFAEGLGVHEVYVASRTAAHAKALAEQARARGLDATALADPGAALDRVTLIVTATTSATPVLPATVREDAFIAAVGAFRPDMAELPPALVRRARLYVDTLTGAQAEAGDLIQAGIDWQQVTPLAADVPRPASGPVIFKSVGHALWDLAAVWLAHRRLHDTQER